jgi:hypothetical protein
MSKCWIYHATEEPRIIDADDKEQYYLNGWADSPAKFVKTTDFGIDPNDAAGVQLLGETMAGIDDRLNGELNLDEMDRTELEEYALRHLDMTFHGRTKPPTMRKKIKEGLQA